MRVLLIALLLTGCASNVRDPVLVGGMTGIPFAMGVSGPVGLGMGAFWALIVLTFN